MNCLIVGGTGFLGGAIADAAVAAGHDVTVLSRGQTARGTLQDSLSNVETIHADRYGGLSELKGRTFEWIFDSCAYTPDAVSKLLNAAGNELKRYVFISSISVYGSFIKRGITEADAAPYATSEDFAIASRVPDAKRTSAFSYGSSYGPLKRASEITAQEQLGDRATALRVGLLAGAGDYTDRLTWWVRRIDGAHGDQSRVPAPGPSSRMVQLIDVRDVADFALRCADKAIAGEFNVTGKPVTLLSVLNEIVRVSNSPAEIVLVDEKALVQAQVSPWTDMPLMAPTAPAFEYFLEVDASRAVAAGLQCRALENTLNPLLVWDRGRRDQNLKAGLTAEQEALLLTSNNQG